MSDSGKNTFTIIGLGGTGIDFLKRLLRDTVNEANKPRTHPPRALGVYFVRLQRFSNEAEPPTKLVRSRQTTFRELVLDFDWALHREKTRDDCIFVHVDDVIEPLLGQIKTNFIHLAGHGRKRQTRWPLINNIARDATRAGCGAWLAWTAGEMLDCGPSAADAGRAFIHQLVNQEVDEETRTILALLADLKPRRQGSMPFVSAHTLRKESVIVVTTVLRDAERAMRWIASLKNGLQAADRIRPLFDNELLELRRCMVDDEPLLRWLGLAATQIVMTEACRVVSSMPAHVHAPFVRLVADWITHHVGTEKGTSIFAASKLLPLLWGRFPDVMRREATTRLENADLAVQSCVLTSAFDALEIGFRGRKQAEIPDFVIDGGLMRYAAPTADPWKDFGIAVACVANRNAVLRAQVELKVTRLRLWRKSMVQAQATDDAEQVSEHGGLANGDGAESSESEERSRSAEVRRKGRNAQRSKRKPN
jgi:hypothetical protein